MSRRIQLHSGFMTFEDNCNWAVGLAIVFQYNSKKLLGTASHVIERLPESVIVDIVFYKRIKKTPKRKSKNFAFFFFHLFTFQ